MEDIAVALVYQGIIFLVVAVAAWLGWAEANRSTEAKWAKTGIVAFAASVLSLLAAVWLWAAS